MKRFRLIAELSTRFKPGQMDDRGNDLFETDSVNYIDQVRNVLRAPLQGMPWLEDAEKSGRVMHALHGKSVGQILELEDADWEFLCQKVRGARWAIIDERLLRFAHTVLNATEDVLDAGGNTTTLPENGRVSQEARA